MTADCPVCGREFTLSLRRTPSGGSVQALPVHYLCEGVREGVHRMLGTVCWGSVREMGLEDVRAAVAILEELGDRLRLAAHP